MKKIILIAFALIIFSTLLFIARSLGLKSDGVPIHQLADDIFNKYDKDKNGELNVTRESFLRTEIEIDTNNTVGSTMIKTESRGLLFTDSDNFGDNDGLVSKSELVKYLQKFDKDGNNELTPSAIFFDSSREWDAFDEKYGERFKYKAK